MSGIPKALGSTPEEFYLVGDAGYVCSDKLLTPYPGRDLDKKLDAYNFYQSQLRIRVEQSFGLFVGRWGILWSPLRLSLEKQTAILHTLFRLHSFCLDHGDNTNIAY